MEVWGDGSVIRDYIYIDDLAKIFKQLIERDVNNIILNIGSGRGYSVSVFPVLVCQMGVKG